MKVEDLAAIQLGGDVELGQVQLGGAANGGGIGRGHLVHAPVSYTHLDVYKRQAETMMTRTLSILGAAALAVGIVAPCPAQFGGLIQKAQDKANQAQQRKKQAEQARDIYTAWTPEQEQQVGEASAAKLINIFGLYDNPQMELSLIHIWAPSWQLWRHPQSPRRRRPRWPAALSLHPSPPINQANST